MGKHSDTDKAIRNIMQWSERPEWVEAQADVFNAHLVPVCERLGISTEELNEQLAARGYDGMLFGIVFEDFISRRLAPDGRNIIDDYLQRRGWRESIPGRRYLEKLRDSVLSLYEIVAVSQSKHCDLRDLINEGETLRVYENLGTQNLVKWDRIAARVLTAEGKNIFSGGILPIPHESSARVLRVLDDARSQLREKLNQAVGVAVVNSALPPAEFNRQLLRESCTAFSQIWLIDVLERLRAPLPTLVNRDGEQLVFTETRFPFQEKDRPAILQRLQTAPEWDCDAGDESAWLWLLESSGTSAKPEHGMYLDSLRNGQHAIYASLKFKSEALVLSANSVERAEQGKQRLAELLQGLVGPPLTKLQTPEQLMAETKSTGEGRDESTNASTLDPELAAAVTRDYLDNHYHQCLDQPIPMLDGKTPRYCATHQPDRDKAIAWLKYLENQEQHRAHREGSEPYDSAWMWEELKLGAYRDE